MSTAEFWQPSSSSPCKLPILPKDPIHPKDHSVNYAQEKVILCFGLQCWKLSKEKWERFKKLKENRNYHTSTVLGDGDYILLAGGILRDTTELLPIKEGSSVVGPKLVTRVYNHCSIKTSTNTVVITGGIEDEVTNRVLKYENIGKDDERPPVGLRNLNEAREQHACGSYTHLDKLVTDTSS